MALEGKGFYVWKIHRCEGGDVSAIAQRAKNAGLSHVLIKIADGPRAYNVDLASNLVEALKSEGIQAWGWQFVYGDEPFGEAEIAIHRTNVLGLDGFIVNAEVAYKNKQSQATVYMERLKSHIMGIPIGLSSFRYPNYHREFPWKQFLTYCDINFPQVYWMQAHNPAQQIDWTIAQFDKISPIKPILPTGAAFTEWGWRPTTGEIREFLTHAKQLGIPAVNFWSWDYAGSSEGADLWNVIAEFDWPVSKPARDIAMQVFDAIQARDLDKIMALYQSNAVLVTANKTAQGHDDIRAYYVDLLGKLSGAEITAETELSQANIRHVRWQALGASTGFEIRDGQDTLGTRQGLIQYHSSVFRT